MEKFFIFHVLMSLLLVVATVDASKAETILTIGLNGHSLFSSDSVFCSTAPAGMVIKECYGGDDFLVSSEDGRLAFLTADLTSVDTINFDHAYISLTEIRTASWATGESNIAITNSELPGELVPSTGQLGTFLLDVDNTLAAGMTAIGSMSGTGIGGNQLLLDITNTINNSLLNNIFKVGLLIEDTINDGLALAFLGENYSSGYFNQYFASSLYEYPSLIFTAGTEITPFDQLPERPTTIVPVNPQPAPVPEPPTLFLLAAGLAITIGVKSRKRRL